MEDVFTSGPTLALFDVIFRHVEGYDGLPDREALKAFILGAEETVAGRSRRRLRVFLPVARHGRPNRPARRTASSG
jgi:hypothetical protein